MDYALENSVRRRQNYGQHDGFPSTDGEAETIQKKKGYRENGAHGKPPASRLRGPDVRLVSDITALGLECSTWNIPPYQQSTMLRAGDCVLRRCCGVCIPSDDLPADQGSQIAFGLEDS